MWGAATREQKRALRSVALSQRNSLSEAESLSRSRSIQAKVLQFSLYRASPSVALYSPIQNEVGTGDILDHALRNGKKVFYPRTGPRDVVALIRIHSVRDLQIGGFGILEPTGEEGLSERDREGLIVFVPGVVFDPRGNRLGRGRGWYDRLLKRLGERATFVALSYEFQIVDEVPADQRDERVDYVVTEERVIECANESTRSSRIS